MGTFQNRPLNYLAKEARGILENQLNEELVRRNIILEKENRGNLELLLCDMEIRDITETLELLGELLIVGSFSAIERHLILILETAFEDTDRRTLYKFRELKRYVKKNGLDIESVVYFEEINEVRLVANSIKHGGVVSRELAECTSKACGEPLSDLYQLYLIKYHPPSGWFEVAPLGRAMCTEGPIGAERTRLSRDSLG